MEKTFLHWFVALLLLLGCSHISSDVYFSRPEMQAVSNEVFDARIETLKQDNPYYVSF